ncbi:hypothetical protein HPP92_000034 [Vanilla planifolia]|uniref:Uncharacterized protein n=1 Tax=Vanilla planifolia TaxID=51239 RepID=A0A835S9F7_VANPL|nr:hypothetical protein HPP92_000034 [Vanilla planifolia]
MESLVPVINFLQRSGDSRRQIKEELRNWEEEKEEEEEKEGVRVRGVIEEGGGGIRIRGEEIRRELRRNRGIEKELKELDELRGRN